MDVVRRHSLALQNQVGLADGVGLAVDLLTEEVGGDLLAPLLGELLKHFFPHGQHAAGPAGAVVEQIGGVFDPVGDGEEDQLGHELHGVARSKVLAGLFVVLLVEPPDQFLEDGAHGVVVQAGMADGSVEIQDRFRTEVYVGRGKLLDERAQSVGLGELGDLIAELEILQDVLNAGREPVEVVLEIGLELLSAGPGPQVLEGKLGGVEECVARRLPKGHLLVGHPHLVQPGLHVQDLFFGGFEHRVEASQDGHGKDDVAVFAADVDVAEHVVGDAPDVIGDPVEVGGGGHGGSIEWPKRMDNSSWNR